MCSKEYYCTPIISLGSLADSWWLQLRQEKLCWSPKFAVLRVRIFRLHDFSSYVVHVHMDYRYGAYRCDYNVEYRSSMSRLSVLVLWHSKGGRLELEGGGGMSMKLEICLLEGVKFDKIA